MPAEYKASGKLAELFARYGVEPFLETTSLLVTLLDEQGNLLSWNPSFDLLRQTLPERAGLADFLAPSSRELFRELHRTALQKRIRTLGTLEFAHEEQGGGYSALFIPLREQRILFIAEPLPLSATLQAVTTELQKTRRILAIKETELKAVLAQAEEVANTDALTFLPNRRQIIGDLQREVIFAERYGTPLAISMIDIDHFKTINDTYGHTAGDEVLRSLVAELRDHIRHPDTIGRYGGEEFLVILPHSTLQAASEQAGRLCRLARSLPINVNGKEIRLTISIGVAQYRFQKEDWQAFLSRADAALYRAKNNGRDQWAASEEQT